MEPKYKIVKFYQKEGKPSKVVRSAGTMSLADAKLYCKRPDSRGPGWFCGFTAFTAVS